MGAVEKWSITCITVSAKHICCIQIYRLYIYCEGMAQTDAMLSETHVPGGGDFIPEVGV
jgi:hypothetical protein